MNAGQNATILRDLTYKLLHASEKFGRSIIAVQNILIEIKRTANLTRLDTKKDLRIVNDELESAIKVVQKFAEDSRELITNEVKIVRTTLWNPITKHDTREGERQGAKQRYWNPDEICSHSSSICYEEDYTPKEHTNALSRSINLDDLWGKLQPVRNQKVWCKIKIINVPFNESTPLCSIRDELLRSNYCLHKSELNVVTCYRGVSLSRIQYNLVFKCDVATATLLEKIGWITVNGKELSCHVVKNKKQMRGIIH